MSISRTLATCDQPLPPYRFATRTGRKVSRAFSFNKSPSKLKRAVSTVMSPFGTLPHQSSMRGATSVNSLAVSV